MTFFKTMPRKIKFLEILSRVLVLLFCFLIVTRDFIYCEFGEIYIGGRGITSGFIFFFLGLGLVIWVLSLFSQKRRNLSVKESRSSFLKFLLICLPVSLLLAVLFTIPCGSTKKAKDSRIISAISQSRIIMEEIYNQDENFDYFTCGYKKMVDICREIDKNYGKEDDKEPIIVHDTPNNSQAVCIYSPLNSRDNFWENYWYCADSEGHADFTEISPANPGYCVKGESAVCPH